MYSNNSLIRLLKGKSDVLNGFIKRCDGRLDTKSETDISSYLGDVQDHIISMMTSSTQSENILSHLRSKGLAQTRITDISQRTYTTRALYKVVLLTIVIFPLNVTSGLFAMYVQVPLTDRDD